MQNQNITEKLPIIVSFKIIPEKYRLIHLTIPTEKIKTSEKLWFFDVFSGYRKKPVAWNVGKVLFRISSFLFYLH